MRKIIRILDYNPSWPRHYEEEHRRLAQALGSGILAIEHVGSTAVPGLGAKPILDLMAALPSLAGAEALKEPLTALGYRYAPEYERWIPERRFYWKGPATAHSHHLHLVERDTDFWVDHLLFRDYLRDHPSVARAYFDLKKQLAARYNAGEIPDYTEAKTPFIQQVLSWARSAEGRIAHPGTAGRGTPAPHYHDFADEAGD